MTVVRMPKNKGTLRCMSYEDTLREMEAFLDGKLDTPQKLQQQVFADITTENASSGGVVRPPVFDDPDATENSSSFGDTASRSEIVSGTSDAEVESEYRDDSGLGPFMNGYGSVLPLRKKKLTNHWRNFIRPLMWRCKWAEIKIKELDSQAFKYSREVDTNDQAKMLELQQYTDFCSKSSPYRRPSSVRKPMKRRKRKIVEAVTDIASYMSHHQIFSYLENKKPEQDGSMNADDGGNLDAYCNTDEFGMDAEWLRDGEESFELILRQIETAQSQVHRLRNRLDMVMLNNGVKFYSSENLSLLANFDAQTSAAQSPAFSPGNVDTMSMGPVFCEDDLQEFDIDDLDLPDISAYEDITEIPDVIESTAGFPSAADVTMPQQQVMESGENTLDDALLQNHLAQDGHTSKGINDYSVNGFQDPERKDQNISTLVACTGVVGEPVDAVSKEKSSLISCLTSEIQIAKTKKKRGERKCGTIGWNMKSTAEPDSNQL